jgi:DNA-dependent RNA polymerase auxiliary subunit epsilon
MPIYYFEVETKQTGWLRMEADSEDEAREDVADNGFDVSDLIDSNVRTTVISIEGGEEED